jgi:hypothetical protein
MPAGGDHHQRQQEHLDDETDLRPEVPPLVERGIDLVE